MGKMIAFYKTIENRVEQVDTLEEGCWINVVNPTEEEIAELTDTYALDAGFVKSALDEEETSRIEVEDNSQTLIIIDIPVTQKEGEAVIYSTMPIGIIFTNTNIITISLKEVNVLKDFSSSLIKGVQTAYKTKFVMQLLFRVAMAYNQYLRQIDKISSYVERKLHKSLRNKELIQLLDLKKSLVYFSTSLKSNEITLEKILRGKIIKLYDDDQDILEDVLIEVKQAIEMTNIYTNILTGTMDSFSSVISNNLNILMKILTSVIILFAIPAVIAGFYSMNVTGIPIPSFWFPIALSVVTAFIVGIILYKKDMF